MPHDARRVQAVILVSQRVTSRGEGVLSVAGKRECSLVILSLGLVLLCFHSPLLLGGYSRGRGRVRSHNRAGACLNIGQLHRLHRNL